MSQGIRDIASGLAVSTLMITTNSQTVGIVLLVFSIIPFGDMSNILVSGGRKATAFSVHGVTCAVMIFAGLLLINDFKEERALLTIHSDGMKNLQKFFHAFS